MLGLRLEWPNSAGVNQRRVRWERYNEEDKAALLSGKIITTDLKKTRDDQLIAAVAMQLNAPIATIAENARKGLNIERDKDVMAEANSE